MEKIDIISTSRGNETIRRTVLPGMTEMSADFYSLNMYSRKINEYCKANAEIICTYSVLKTLFFLAESETFHDKFINQKIPPSVKAQNRTIIVSPRSNDTVIEYRSDQYIYTCSVVYMQSYIRIN